MRLRGIRAVAAAVENEAKQQCQPAAPVYYTLAGIAALLRTHSQHGYFIFHAAAAAVAVFSSLRKTKSSTENARHQQRKSAQAIFELSHLPNVNKIESTHYGWRNIDMAFPRFFSRHTLVSHAQIYL
jgi:hypothetical protein